MTYTDIQSPRRKAVIYIRISTAKQKQEGDGLNSQKRSCLDYARYKGLVVGDEHIFSDIISGKYATRPGMDRMLDFLRQNSSEHYAVIIDDISRLARDIVAHIQIRSEISEAGGQANA